MNNQFLNELHNFSKEKLNKTTTEIYYLSGRSFKLNNKGEQVELDTESQLVQYTHEAMLSRQLGYIIDTVADYSIDKIIDQLYLSGDDVATNFEILKKNQITHILNVTTNVANKFNKEIKYKTLSIYDLASQVINFTEAFEFIELAMNEPTNNVLVHCNQGVSRSASIIIGYLIQKKVFATYQQAYEFVKQKRPKIMPNNGFIKQLNELANKTI